MMKLLFEFTEKKLLSKFLAQRHSFIRENEESGITASTLHRVR